MIVTTPQPTVGPDPVVTGKLDRLLAPELTRYALRFVNEGEYRVLTGRGRSPMGESWVSWRCHEGSEPVDPRSFRDYLTAVSRTPHGWLNAISLQTDWGAGTVDVEAHKLAVKFLLKAHREALLDGVEGIRARTLQRFNSILSDRAAKVDWISEPRLRAVGVAMTDALEAPKRVILSPNPARNALFDEEIARLVRRREDPRYGRDLEGKIVADKADIKMLATANTDLDSKNAMYVYDRRLGISSEVDETAVGKMKRFSENPASFDPAELRELIEGISRSPAWNPAFGRRSSTAPYHILAVFSEEAIVDYRPGAWQEFKGEISGGALLGAVAILPHRSLVKEMIAAQRDAGDFRHPIFDAVGRVQFP